MKNFLFLSDSLLSCQLLLWPLIHFQFFLVGLKFLISKNPSGACRIQFAGRDIENAQGAAGDRTEHGRSCCATASGSFTTVNPAAGRAIDVMSLEDKVKCCLFSTFFKKAVRTCAYFLTVSRGRSYGRAGKCPASVTFRTY